MTDIFSYDIGADKTEVSPERRYEYWGKVYRIRDRYYPDTKPYPTYVTSEYATKDADGNTVWNRCKQGVVLDAIQHFERVA